MSELLRRRKKIMQIPEMSFMISESTNFKCKGQIAITKFLVWKKGEFQPHWPKHNWMSA